MSDGKRESQTLASRALKIQTSWIQKEFRYCCKSSFWVIQYAFVANLARPARVMLITQMGDRGVNVDFT
jgi:hypothetical protein